MSIKDLNAYQFRNLVDGKISLHSEFNFILGDNGSGKSSLLESIYYLSHGKSFRTTNVSNLVRNESQRFVLSAKTFNDQMLGIEYSLSGEKRIKIDGERQTKLSELAKNLAVQVVTPESFKLFIGGPRERRKFIDLGLFHVKHSFPEVWRQFNKTLKQRNACLKQRLSEQQLQYWTEQFCQLSETIAELRSGYIKELSIEVTNWLSVLLPEINDSIKLQYLQGWHSKKELFDVLTQNKDKELERGFSLYGAHKFDVRFQFNTLSLEQRLSRGQQKLFLLALTFAQTKLIEKVKRVKPILLIDDIGAELDISSRTAMSVANQLLNCQSIITAIDKSAVEPLVPKNKNYKMFHVKHGNISLMSE
ncbi:DNA replication/repair protein RecF [Thalassotalea sp. 1_MG-2023]|uniref:DNA replication/repair protein RecF n=1 Tax=Thalassotalea sp. 1_MG-2023 TaxID=3062680 RepID=UPI0026E2BBDC|nr:DNA replication/repair protein RecF [Thalassotalea sp. 1_MG-2023]MDO6427638.1 DNA replication/repair protein RecF [Thalassotalea sp. 1_MG-2023]